LAGFYEIAPQKSLAIDYQSTGMIEGSVRVYVTGDSAVVISNQSFSGQPLSPKTSINQVEIHLPDGVYRYDLNTGTGKKFANRRYLLKKGLAKLAKSDRDYFAQYSEKMRGHMVSRLIGADNKPSTVNFLGYKALRYELSTGARLTLWNGIVMEMELVSQNFRLLATKVNLNFSVPDSIFNIVGRNPAVADTAASSSIRKQVGQIIEAVRARKLDSYLAPARSKK